MHIIVLFTTFTYSFYQLHYSFLPTLFPTENCGHYCNCNAHNMPMIPKTIAIIPPTGATTTLAAPVLLADAAEPDADPVALWEAPVADVAIVV
jgi:hypothetical protein